MLRFGFTYPLHFLKDLVIEKPDFYLLQQLLPFAVKYNIDLDYENSKWENLLLQSPVYMTDFISAYFINKDAALSYNKVVAYANEEGYADFSQMPSKTPYNMINGRRYIDLSVEKEHRLKSLRDPNSSWRHGKDRDALNRIRAYERSKK